MNIKQFRNVAACLSWSLCIGSLAVFDFLGAGMDEQFGNIGRGISIVLSNFKTVTITLWYSYIYRNMFEAYLTNRISN